VSRQQLDPATGERTETVACPGCQDRAWVEGEARINFGRTYTTMKPCPRCLAGRMVAAGMWLDKLEPRRGYPEAGIKDAFIAWKIGNPEYTSISRDIDDLRDRRRKRKVKVEEEAGA